MRIAHTADIHWRGLSRHDEYRKVFSAFVESCHANKVDHIFVGGDIFHTKTIGISPEFIEQISWWFNSLSQVAPTHLILGNHDGNLVNLSRQDAISPIVSALNNPSVYLYKKSGIYQIEPGFNWCVFSPFDEENWKNVKPEPGMVNIACFHGPIQGSSTEVGWMIDEGRNVEFFNGFDFAMLGDIHKKQFLAYRDNKPWVAYPGTPIQQNYAEDLKHGYLLWDIKDRDSWSVKFEELPNPQPFVTLTWEGTLDSLGLEIGNYPKGTRYRIRSSDHLSQKDVVKINNYLYGVHSASEVTHKSEFVANYSQIKTGNVSMEKRDLRSSSVLLSLVKEHHKNSSYSKETWTEVEEAIKLVLSDSSTSDEITRNSKWSLRQLRFDNMFTYGEKNVINFDSLNGIVGIFGANRIGKSSIVGTIMYSLFNTTDRGPIKNLHVCNVRKPYCSSRAIINYQGTDYVIERQTTKSENKKGVVSASTALNLYKFQPQGELQDLSGEQRNDTEKQIRSLIGSSEDFLMTSLAAQGEISQFISQGATKRRSILSRFLDLDVFDKMHDIVGKEANGLKFQLRNFPQKDWDSLISSTTAEISLSDEDIVRLEQEIAEKQIHFDELQRQLHRFHDVTSTTQDQVDSFQTKVETAEFLLQSQGKRLSSLADEVAENQKKIDSIIQLRQENDVTALLEKRKLYQELTSELSELKHSLEKDEVKLKQHQKSIKILDEVPCGDQYPTCKFIKDAYESKDKLPRQLAIVDASRQKIQKLLDETKTILEEGCIERLSKLEKLQELSQKLEVENSRKENELYKLRSSYNAGKDELGALKVRLSNLEEALKNQENVEAVSIKSKLETLGRAIKGLYQRKLELATNKGKLVGSLEKLQEEKTARDSLLEKLKVQEIIQSAFSKKGIPMLITRSQIPAINAEIARILHGIVDFSIELENEEDADCSEIYINYGDSKRVIELCSGMEKTIASLAVRVAMINISSLPRSDMFIIDEGFGTLDEAGVEACNRLLRSLKRYFKTIVVITHVDGIKDVVDHTLEINKVEKDAKVVMEG
jgi:DNA repair exonuclease SbcCD ATPase subunit/DNA repair exonuclease SbcCD nuclease subunit